jgi:hypothetical protein
MKIRVPAGLVSDEGSLELQMEDYSLCAYMAFPSHTSGLVSLTKDTNAIRPGPSPYDLI